MPRLSRRLLLLPLLLLVPLGVLKWRADHPPLSEMDKKFQADLSRASAVTIMGNNPVWGAVTHLSDRQDIIVTDRKLIGQLAQTFRLSDDTSAQKWFDRANDITLCIETATDHTVRYFGYSRNTDTKGSSVATWDDTTTNTTKTPRVKMPARFAPNFEAMIGQLAQRATAKDKHPEIVLVEPS